MVVGVLAVLAASLLLGGCGVISGFGDKDPHPPTELVDLAPEITVATLWSRQVGVGMDRRLSLIPALHGGRLHIADAEGRIFVLDAESGKVLWEQETGLPFSGGPAVDAVVRSMDQDTGAGDARYGENLAVQVGLPKYAAITHRVRD